jgi:hypothetical protein
LIGDLEGGRAHLCHERSILHPHRYFVERHSTGSLGAIFFKTSPDAFRNLPHKFERVTITRGPR